MTREFREIISHTNERWDGMRLLMAVVPATDYMNGCVILKIQKQMGKDEWDYDNEHVAYLSCADIGRLLTVLDGCKECVLGLGYGDTEVGLVHINIAAPDEYFLYLYNTDRKDIIRLSTHEAIIVKEILRTAIFRIVFA